MKKLTKLTTEQKLLLPVVRDEWLAHGLSTEPADRQSAEGGVRMAYKAAKLEPPGIMTWLRSPLEGAVGAAMLSKVGAKVRGQVRAQAGAQVGDQAGAQVGDQVGAQVGAQVLAQVGAQVRAQVGDQVWAQVRDQVGYQVRDQVWYQVWAEVWDQVWDQVRDQVRYQVWDQVRDQVGAQAWYQIYRCGYGQHDANWIGFCDAFGQFGIDTSQMNGLAQVSRSAGWWWPFSHACILTERPVRLSRDDQGRLHSEAGMAIEYPDGWGVYAIHGVRCPEKVILHPETLTAAETMGEPNAELRRIMVERFGMERLVRETNARKLDCDEHGTLWQVPLPGDEPIVAVEVVNSTPEPDGSYRRYMLRVPPYVRKARAAVAWTFGVSEQEYAPSVQS